MLEVGVPWDGLRLAYTLAPMATTTGIVGSPRMRDPGAGRGAGA